MHREWHRVSFEPLVNEHSIMYYMCLVILHTNAMHILDYVQPLYYSVSLPGNFPGGSW